MKTVGVIFGGVTCEHDVSIISGLQLIENTDKTKYEIVPIYIHEDGKWYTGEKLLDSNIYKKFSLYEKELKKAIIPPDQDGLLIFEKGLFPKTTFKKLDVVIPAMHGMNGEDGTLQGLLELANIPYTSSSVLGASVGMDKILMKHVFESYQLPVLPYTYFIREEWEEKKEDILKRIEEKLTYPVFVKPSNLGSSIGISKANDRAGLEHAIEIAIHYDERIIVENGVEDLIEINCSGLGIGNEVEASVCERPVSWEEFLTFEDKYLRGGKNKKQNGMESMDRQIPADISEEMTKQIQNLTKQVFKALNSKGVVRVDFIIDQKTKEVYINEINTIPGSFSFYLWQYTNLEYPKLIDRLIEIALKAQAEKKKNNYTYQSNLIASAARGMKTHK